MVVGQCWQSRHGTTFFLLLLTVAHDWGYFSVLAPALQSLQTPYDYLANSISWLPISIGALSVLVLFSTAVALAFRASSSLKYAEELPSGYKERAYAKLARYGSLALFVAGGFEISALIFAVSNGAGHDWQVGCAVGLLCLYMSITLPFTYNRTTRTLSKMNVFCIWLVPILIDVSFGTGTIDAIFSMKSSSNIYRVETKDPLKPAFDAHLLRSIEKGLLLSVENSNQVILLRWDDVKKIERNPWPQSPPRKN